LCSMFWIYASANIADVGAPMASPSVCNIYIRILITQNKLPIRPIINWNKAPA
jgi:hypothetical protein